MPAVGAHKYVPILGLLLVAAATSRTAPEPQEKPLAEVRFTLHRNAVILPAVVSGRDTVHLLLDTGWGPLALVSTSAQRLGLVVDPPAADGIGRAQVSSLAIGEAIQKDPLLEVFPTESLAPLIGPFDGVLSTAFFRDLVLQIDYPAGIVRFFRRSPPSRPASGSSCTSVPMVFSAQTGALPFTDSVFVDGRPARGLFDTGGAGGFVAMRRLVERAQLRALPDTSRAKTGIGMLSGGTMVQQRVQFAQVGRITVGSFEVKSPRVMLAPPQLEGDDWGHDLIIGYGFMRNYVVTFDYPGRRVVFCEAATSRE
ncbi:MAG TPA: retropepsin-like aspartic protease [Candidatus Krumholzibacteria bacterium]|jgi:aspartyl protease|nr:retropepsin-like aspartic protease [Candidatus Krumholzibacteria bacterium]